MGSVGYHDVRYSSPHCQLAVQRLSASVLMLKISGTDIGEFGNGPMSELSRQLKDSGPVELFIDARKVRAASIDVSGKWAKWLGAERGKLRAVHMLTGSKFIQITANFVRRFAAIQDIMAVYTEVRVFEDALAGALDPQN